MTDQVFATEGMSERERQLSLALLDCAGICCDVNFTQDRILGTPVHIVDGKEYDILEQIGKPKNCSYSEIVDYWQTRMPEEEREPYAAFACAAYARESYAAGKRALVHRFWTYDILGDLMLAEQNVRLYQDANGDLMGLIYVTNCSEVAWMRANEEKLRLEARIRDEKLSVMENFAANIPGGYHRCAVEEGFPLEFASESFLDIVGWTREELAAELDNKVVNLVVPEDRDFFLSMEPVLREEGKVNLVYRVRRRDGSLRWVQDSTLLVERGGKAHYQCILNDITDFVRQQEEITNKNIALRKKESFYETIESTLPGGYIRCEAEADYPFIYISRHFCDILGYTKREIREEMNNCYVNLVWDEDRHLIRSNGEIKALRGTGNMYETMVYRMKHKSGGYRWVSDSTMYVDMGEESFFQCSIVDITDFIEGINDAKRAAEVSNLAKSTFLFNASHDIRTPMNAIQGFARIIENNAEDTAMVRDTIRKITQAGDTLMALLNDVLDLAKIERGKDEVNRRKMNMTDHADKLAEMFGGDMKQAGLIFCQESSVVHPRVLGDELKLTRIAMNLLGNAKKFTPRGGSVTFGIRERDFDGKTAWYCLYVRDTGIGMSREFQSHAFEQFERERTSTESGILGSGLGLAITKRLADCMNGTCEIQSELGKGSEITVSVPLDIVEEEPGRTEPAPAAADFAGKRLLLVEDNEFNREIARYIFEEMNFTVDEAENGAVCVDKLLRGEPGYYDLILMDIQMPVMDGYTATREIRGMENETVSRVPIVAMTANTFAEDRKRCLEAGMNGHIGKPFQVEDVLRELREIFKQEGETT